MEEKINLRRKILVVCLLQLVLLLILIVVFVIIWSAGGREPSPRSFECENRSSLEMAGILIVQTMGGRYITEFEKE